MHCAVLTGDDVFVWGGYQKDMPMVHDSPEKRQMTSSLEKLDLPASTWERRLTTGQPPNGTMGYSCCQIGDLLYFFGGKCIMQPSECYHNNLFELNSITNEWEEIVPTTIRPMRKTTSGMAAFSTGIKNYILLIGGYGPTPADPSEHFQYIPDYNRPSFCRTNEIHVMCVSSLRGNGYL